MNDMFLPSEWSEDTHAILDDNTSFDFVADTDIDDVICALLHSSE